MERYITLFLCITFLPILHGKDPVELDLKSPPCEWEIVLESLAANNPVTSAFMEYRTNPFHKRPRRFSGDIFWHPEYGLSLQYRSPISMKINITSDDVSIHRKDDPPRQLEIPEDNPALKMFFKLFDWDMDWLNENFSFSGEIEESGWKLRMRPVDEESRKKLSKIDLEGTENILSSIILDLSGGKEVRIVLSDQEVPWNPDSGFLNTQFGRTDVAN